MIKEKYDNFWKKIFSCFQKINELGTEMESIYSTGKICKFDEDPVTCIPSLELEPGKTS